MTHVVDYFDIGYKQSGAVLSDCGGYRYRLWRRWNDEPYLVFAMLNPSTADAGNDDPTIRKCIGFAKRLGFGGIQVVNLFAWRETSPEFLRVRSTNGFDIVGRDNDAHIRAATLDHPRVVAAWGANVATWKFGAARALVVSEALSRDAELVALRINKDGTPAHPLMLPYTCELAPWNPLR